VTAGAHDPHVAPDLHLTWIVVRRRALSEPSRLAWAVGEARSWLGPEVEASESGMHRHHADLRLRAGEAPADVTFRKAAYVDIGDVRALDAGFEVEIGWRASSFAPLFPVFAGTLVVRGDEITLSGSYAPPLGVIGRAADRALLHIAAEGTARWLLARLDEVAATGGTED
jgi:hypothetical protein